MYPLLAAKHFHWSMLATEKDIESAQIALNNVTKNNLDQVVAGKVVQN